MVRVGDTVIVNNAWRYDCFAPERIKGTVYIIWSDGDIGVSYLSGSLKVNPKDIIKEGENMPRAGYGKKDGSQCGQREGGQGRNRTKNCRHPKKRG